MKTTDSVVLASPHLDESIRALSETQKQNQIKYVKDLLLIKDKSLWPESESRWRPFRQYLAFYLSELLGSGSVLPYVVEAYKPFKGMKVPSWIGEASYHKACREVITSEN